MIAALDECETKGSDFSDARRARSLQTQIRADLTVEETGAVWGGCCRKRTLRVPPARSRLAVDTQYAVKTDVQTSNEAAVHQLLVLTASPESGGLDFRPNQTGSGRGRSHPPIGRTLDQGPIAGYFTFASFGDVMFSVGIREGHCGSDVVRFSRCSANYAIERGAFSSRSSLK